MTSVTASWYTSGTFWTAAGVVVALTVGVLGAVVAWRVGFPRRRLTYDIASVTRLITPPVGFPDLEFQVRHRGTPLANPHIVIVRLEASGRRDIPSSAFDQGRPLLLDLGAPIVALLEADTTPGTTTVPELTVDGSTIRLAPSRIDRRQRITVTALTDGPPTLTCRSPLNDVKVEAAVARFPWGTARAMLITGAIFFYLFWVALKQGVRFGVASFAMAGAIILLEMLWASVLVEWWRLRRFADRL